MSLSAALLLSACGGGGAYGFAREYVPLGEEEAHLETATEVTYEDVRRDPQEFQSTTLAWFGVVTSVQTEGSNASVQMTFRTLAARNLCGDETAGSCRVTVSERAGGPFTATLTMRAEDTTADETRLYNGSLLRVFGSPTGEFDDDGGPILNATWYRHWPRGKYVTTGARGSMRR